MRFGTCGRTTCIIQCQIQLKIEAIEADHDQNQEILHGRALPDDMFPLASVAIPVIGQL